MNGRRTDRTPTASDRAPRRPKPIAVRATLVVSLIPAICAFVLLAVAAARLPAEQNRLDDSVARVASAWIADRLALAAENERTDILMRAQESLGVVTGLYDTNGNELRRTAIGRIDGDVLLAALSGEIVEASIDGRAYRLAATTLRPPLSRMNVVVAAPESRPSPLGLALIGKLVLAALVLLALVAVFGLCLGMDLGSQVEGLARRLDRIFTQQPGPREESPPVAVEELAVLAEEVRKLEDRLHSEMTLFNGTKREVEALDGRRNDLLTAVSVELHRPLSQIVSLAERLLEGKDGHLLASQEEDVRIVKKAGIRLQTMVGEIIDLSTIIVSDVELEMESVDMVEVAREVVDTIRGEAVKKRLAVRLNAPADRPAWVRGNRQRLWQVITNLLSNAVKFTEEGEVVVTVARGPDAEVTVEVRDTGIGIASMEQASVFDTFRQMGGRSGRKRGTGLGLAICRRLVEIHGGRIDVSSALGQGATFKVVLPGVES
jgi:signal transduction histidine kinase